MQSFTRWRLTIGTMAITVNDGKNLGGERLSALPGESKWMAATSHIRSTDRCRASPQCPKMKMKVAACFSTMRQRDGDSGMYRSTMYSPSFPSIVECQFHFDTKKSAPMATCCCRCRRRCAKCGSASDVCSIRDCPFISNTVFGIS
jgi:hypothetical protein